MILWYLINESQYLGRLDFSWCFQLALLLGVLGPFFICLFSHQVHISIYSPPLSRSPLPLYVGRVVFKNHLPKYIISLSSPSPFALQCMLKLPIFNWQQYLMCSYSTLVRYAFLPSFLDILPNLQSPVHHLCIFTPHFWQPLTFLQQIFLEFFALDVKEG